MSDFSHWTTASSNYGSFYRSRASHPDPFPSSSEEAVSSVETSYFSPPLEEPEETQQSPRSARRGPMISAAGDFPFISFFRKDCVGFSQGEMSGIDTTEFGSNSNPRVVSSADPLDTSRSVVLVTQGTSPHLVLGFDVNSGKLRMRLNGNRKKVAMGLASVGTGRSMRVITGGLGDHQILVFDGSTGRKMGFFQNAPKSTWRLVTFPEWPNDVFVGGLDGDEGHLSRYDLTMLAQTARFSGAPRQSPFRSCPRNVGCSHQDRVTDIGVDVSKSLLYSVSMDGSLVHWDMKTGRWLTKQSLATGGISLISVEEKNLVLVGLANGTVLVFDSRSKYMGWPLKRYKVASHLIHTMIRVNENRFAAASLDGTVALWSLRSFETAETDHSDWQNQTLPASVSGLCVVST